MQQASAISVRRKRAVESFKTADDKRRQGKRLCIGTIEPGIALFAMTSVLTLELKNLTRYHTIRLHDGVRIGQMVFHRSAVPVPHDCSYAKRGRYNGNDSVQGVIGAAD